MPPSSSPSVPWDIPERVIDDNAPELNDTSVWSRRFNLLEPLSAYFQVTKAGSYVVTSSGADAVYRFEPIIHIGVDYKAPEFQPSGYVWKLDPGYYVLTGEPKADGKGILDIRVAAEGVTGGGDQAKEVSVLFPSQALQSNFNYTLYLNRQPGVKAGVVLRRLPIDLRAGLPVVLKAGQTLDIPVTAPRDGRISAIAEDATLLPFAIDHGAAVTEWRGDGARHVLTIANTTDKAFNTALRFTPDALAPETPLPAISAEALQRSRVSRSCCRGSRATSISRQRSAAPSRWTWRRPASTGWNRAACCRPKGRSARAPWSRSTARRATAPAATSSCSNISDRAAIRSRLRPRARRTAIWGSRRGRLS